MNRADAFAAGVPAIYPGQMGDGQTYRATFEAGLVTVERLPRAQGFPVTILYSAPMSGETARAFINGLIGGELEQ